MKFRFNKDFIVDTEESPWKTEGLRIGIWGGSGSGKSNTAALLGEQFLSQGGVLVVIEPRAEYHTLKEKFDVVVCGGPYSKDLDFVPSSPATYAKAVVEQGVSIIFYTSDVEDETKLVEFISKFIRYLLKYNEVAKRPIMLIVEETEEYGPMNTKGRVCPPWVFSRMIRQLKNAQRDARKLNIVTVSLSPRPQEVNFTLRQLCNLTLFGKFSAQDAMYVDRECLRPLREKGQSFYKGADLIHLKTGHFAVILSGKAIPIQAITQPRLTTHGAVTPKLKYTAPRTEQTRKAVTDLAKTIERALEKESQEQSELEKAKRQIRDLAKKLEAAEEKAKIKLSMKEMFEAGAEPAKLAEKLANAEEEKANLEQQLRDEKLITKDLEGKVKLLKKYEAFDEALSGIIEAKMPTALPGFEPGPGVPSEVVVTQEFPQISLMKEMPVVKASEKTWQGRLVSLVAAGFFDVPRKLGDVQRELDRVFAMRGRAATISKELAALCPMRILQRKQASGSWSYSVFSGAKERVKTKEAEA